MRLVYCFVLVAALLPVAEVPAETPTLDAIKERVEAAWKNVSSLTGDVTLDFVMPFTETPLALTGSGQVHYLREDKKEMYRKTVAARLPEPFVMEMKLDVLFDGKNVHTTTELMGQSQKQQGPPSLRQGALPLGGAALIEAMVRDMELTVLPNATADGRAVFVIEGRAKDPQIPFSKAVFFIDQELGMHRKIDIYQPDGSVGISERIANIQLDSRPASSLFAPSR